MANLSLLPYPRSLTTLDGSYHLEPQRRIVLQASKPATLRAAGERLQAALSKSADLNWELAASALGPADEIGAVLRITPDGTAHEQGYKLTINSEGILIEARTTAGVFYGVCTLAQIIAGHSRRLPAVQIEDWPDFASRGVMLDISRDKVPTMETLYSLVDMLAALKINQFQLYTEHTFAYRQHPEVWSEASPVTGDDILALDAYCRERCIELVPNQNSFGHMHRWLEHARYAPLGEVTDSFSTPWGTHSGPFSLAPGDPGSLELITSLYDELLPHFSSRQFNVGLDETFDLGQGRSKEECEARGTHRVYLDFLLKIYREVSARDSVMQFWGDIIVQEPDLIAELPKDSVALEWGYEADHPFDEHGKQFADSGIPFYVCPGTSAWNTIGGRTDNAVGNMLNAAENGLKHGAIGYLNTDWGDNGHWQAFPISFLGYAVGAAYSWALEANRDMDIPDAVGRHAFGDQTGAMGRVAYDLGNVYKATGTILHNSTVFFWLLQRSFAEIAEHPRNPEPDFDAALAAIDAAMEPLSEAHMHRPDATLIVEEFQNTARMMRHAARRGQLAKDGGAADAATLQELGDDLRAIVREYKRLWLERNRIGGLDDSVARFAGAQSDYKVAAKA